MLQALKVTLWVLPNLLLKEFKTLEILYKKKKKNVELPEHNGSKNTLLFIQNYAYFFA